MRLRFKVSWCKGMSQTRPQERIDSKFRSVHRRNAAIKSFKESTARVMLLSLSNSASGTNLTEATHILLLGMSLLLLVFVSVAHMLDPVQGTKAEASAIEGQAVGRAHRQGQKKAVCRKSQWTCLNL